MSWMDSWSRPSKSQATPPPFYLLPNGHTTKYCKSCGRVVGRKAGGGGGNVKEGVKENATPPAYCSVKCRARKPGVVDKRIEECFGTLLRGGVWNEGGGKSDGHDDSSAIEGEEARKGDGRGGGNRGGKDTYGNGSAGYKGGKVNSKGKKKKGESRVLVMCDEVERVFFARKEDPEKQFGRRKNRARRGVKDGDVWRSVDMEDDFEPIGKMDKVRRRIAVLVDSDGEARNIVDREEGSSSDEGEVSRGDVGGARLSTDVERCDIANALDEEKLARLGEKKDLKTWLDTNHNTVNIEAVKAKLPDQRDNGGDDLEPTLPTTSADEADLDADVLARLSIRSGTRIRPSQTVSEVNGGVGGEKGVKERIVENDEMLMKRREGQRKAEEREQVRCAARRLVAFGLLVNRGSENEERMLCEAVMKGEVVESSFAKGDWGIRWRE